MANLNHAVIEGLDFTSKISFSREFIQFLITNRYHWLDVSEYGTIFFYREKPIVLSWYREIQLPEFNRYGFVSIPLCSVVHF